MIDQDENGYPIDNTQLGENVDLITRMRTDQYQVTEEIVEKENILKGALTAIGNGTGNYSIVNPLNSEQYQVRIEQKNGEAVVIPLSNLLKPVSEWATTGLKLTSETVQYLTQQYNSDKCRGMVNSIEEYISKYKGLIEEKKNAITEQTNLNKVDNSNTDSQVNQNIPPSDNSDNKIYYVTNNEIKETLSDDEDESNYAVVRGNAGYTSYLQNYYPTEIGKSFAKSETGSNYLKQLEPVKQKETVDSVSSMLSDPQKSYATDATGQIPEGHYKIALDNNSVKGVDPSKLDSKEKETLGELEKAGIAKKYSSSDTSNNSSSSNDNNSSNNTDLKKPDSRVTDITQEDLKDYNDASKKEGKLIIADKEVPYIKVNGYNKIRFPEVDKGRYAIPIMGLPPTRIRRSEQTPLVSKNAFDLITPGFDELLPEMYIYDEDEQLKRSFLKLNITPLDVEFVNGVNGKVRDKKEKENMLSTNKSIALNVSYNFAVQATGNLSFNHSNTYNASSSEKWLGGLFDTVSGISRELGGLTNVTGGYFGSGGKALSGFGHQIIGNAEQGLAEILESLKGDPNNKNSVYNTNSEAKGFVDVLSKVGKTTLNNLTGARLDIPDVWVDSSTNIQHQFKIDLRTLNPDPESDQYFKDIILPLYILLTLALPTEADGISYKTPPYIKCTLDQFVKIKLGAITNISWNIPLDEVNFRRAPRHVEVNLTIKDLYSVMKQEAYDINNNRMVNKDTENMDITTKKEFVENFVKYSKETGGSSRPTTNEPYYLTEFSRIPAYMAALENYKKEQAAKKEQQQKEASENAQAGSKQDTKSVSADTSKTAQAAKEGADKNVQLVKDGKKTNFITSIGNAITGVTKGIKNVMAGVNSAIQPVRNLINTGKLVMNSVNGLKNSVKLIGQTANLDGILNGQFASSVGFAFSNIANATDVATAISNSCVGGGSLKTILNDLGNVPQAILNNNIANCITDKGNVTLSNQIRDSAASMYGLANMFGQTYANVTGLKNLSSRGSDIISQASVLFDNLGGIANGLDSFTIGQSVGSTSNSGISDDPLLSRYVSSMLNSATSKGLITSGEATSNKEVQDQFKEAAQIAMNEMTASLPVTQKVETSSGESVEYTSKDFLGSNSSSTRQEFSNAITAKNYWKSTGKSDEMAKALATLSPEEQQSVDNVTNMYEKFKKEGKSDEMAKALALELNRCSELEGV